jgi:Ca2+-transporting ATPase
VLGINASLEKEETGEAVGHTLEVTLLVAGADADIRRNELLDTMPEEREVAFEPATKMMATFHRHNGGYYVAVKGAPEVVLGVSSSILTEDGPKQLNDDQRGELTAVNDRLAGEGLRILALARREADDPDSDPYAGLTLLGLVGLLDPPRKEVPDAVEASKRAGVRVIMVTGDQAATARYVAAAVGLQEDDTADVIHGREIDELDASDGRILRAGVFARVDPKQKLRLISAHQKNGAVVGMTGDGVNDAPALKRAAIGVAMGRTGTDVAKEAAELVLLDDSFPTLVEAVREGRTIYNNLKKTVLASMTTNMAELTIVLLGLVAVSMGDWAIPILAIQMLAVDLLAEVAPLTLLTYDPSTPEMMREPPRDPASHIMNARSSIEVALLGLLIGALAFGNFAVYMAREGVALTTAVVQNAADPALLTHYARATTLAYLTIVYCQFVNILSHRHTYTSLFNRNFWTNRILLTSIAISIGMVLLGVYGPYISDFLSFAGPRAHDWAYVLGAAAVYLGTFEVMKAVKRTRRGRKALAT